MGVTAFGLLIIGLLSCVILTQKKSKILFFPSFIRLFTHPFVWEAFLGASCESSTRHSLVGQRELDVACTLQELRAWGRRPLT